MELTPKQIKSIEKEIKKLKKISKSVFIANLVTSDIESLHQQVSQYLDGNYSLDEERYDDFSALQIYETVTETDEEFEKRKERVKEDLKRCELKKLQQYEQLKKELE